jgi:hypothetical protein
MLRKTLIVLAGILISMGLGAILGLWQCSQRKWCPRYLNRQLDAWRKQMVRRNAERHAHDRKPTPVPTPPTDEAA